MRRVNWPPTFDAGLSQMDTSFVEPSAEQETYRCERGARIWFAPSAILIVTPSTRLSPAASQSDTNITTIVSEENNLRVKVLSAYLKILIAASRGHRLALKRAISVYTSAHQRDHPGRFCRKRYDSHHVHSTGETFPRQKQ